jgi:flagellar hook-length control protein FliK
MNTATGLVSTTPLQVALQVSPDPAVPAGGGDFMAALAAACVAEPESALPEGMQSAAAMAWLAGLAGSNAVTAAQQTVVPANDSRVSPLIDAEPGAEPVPDAALGILQDMLAPAVVTAPREATAEADAASQACVMEAQAGVAVAASLMQNREISGASGTESEMPSLVEAAESPAAARVTLPSAQSPAVFVAAPALAAAAALPARTPVAHVADQTDDQSLAADLAATTAVADGDPSGIPAHRAAPTAVPLALMRAMAADGVAEMAAATANAGAVVENVATRETPVDSGMGERLISALADRSSMRADVAGPAIEGDRNAVSGPNLYASTREAVAITSGQVSTRPEVVHSTVGSPRWANELGSRLAMMTVRGQHEGSLTLTPEHLGPLEVRISVNQDTTNVWFGAQHADTRAALADAIPRLREMFAASGLALGQAGVSQDMPGREPPPAESTVSRLTAEPDAPQVAAIATARVSTRLLDAWA